MSEQKKMEDYLHLYLGCRLISDTGSVILMAVVKEIPPCSVFEIAVINGNQTYTTKIDRYKPVLRPLSDMTEEEMQECGNLVYDFRGDADLNKWRPSDFEVLLLPEQFHWLLKQGFDLFGLIDAGLAIDKSKY